MLVEEIGILRKEIVGEFGVEKGEWEGEEEWERRLERVLQEDEMKGEGLEEKE